MKKFFSYFTIAALFAGMTACGGKKEDNTENSKEIVIVPESSEISGDLAGCFTVVERNYKPSEDLIGNFIVELTRTDKELPFDMTFGDIQSYDVSSLNNIIKVGFGVEFLDEDGNIIDKCDLSSPYSSQEPITLVKSSPGTTSSITFSLDKDKADKVSKFRVTSGYELLEGKGSTSSSTSFDIPDYTKAVEEYQKEIDKAVDEYQKEINKSVENYQKELDKAIDRYSF